MFDVTLDDFNTGSGNVNTPRAGWLTSAFKSTTDLGTYVVSTGTASGIPPVTQPSSNIWAGINSDNVEVWVTMLGGTSSTSGAGILFRVTNQGTSTPTGYNLHHAAASVGTFTLSKWIAGTQSTITTFNQAHTAGDTWGVKVYGSTIETWYKIGAGAPSMLNSTNDSSITNAGRIGIRAVDDQNNSLDTFGGFAPIATSYAFPLTPDSVKGVAFG